MIRHFTLMLAVASALFASANARAVVSLTQHIDMAPGWNAIYLEVDPEDPDPMRVFEGLPVESVWTTSDTLVSAEFIEDPSESFVGRPGWIAWFPPDRPEMAEITSLVQIAGNRPYLVKLRGNDSVTLSIGGSPRVTRRRWVGAPGCSPRLI
jgi:hypothetical protein